jgi:hypothetical protein
VTATNLYHVGVLVTDLDAAMAQFAEVLGVTFGEPRTVAAVVEEGGTRTERPLHVVYSIEGPPFLELIEAQEGGVWGGHHGEGLHHIGSWQTGLAERLAAMAEAGVIPEAVMTIDGTLIAAYLEPSHLHQTRVELVSPRSER